MLQQPERPLGGEVVPEHPVPAGEDLQRARPVEVQEVDVGDVAAGDALGEVEHEALFHRPAREAVQAAQRDRHEHGDDGEAEPRAERRRPTAGAARPSRRARTPWGRRRTPSVRPTLGLRPRLPARPGRSSVSGSRGPRRYPGGHHARGRDRRTSGSRPTDAGDRDPVTRWLRDASRPRRRSSRRRTGGAVGSGGGRSLGATVLVGLPLIVAVAVLRSRPWHPVLDLAMTEFRVRDVFTGHTPLIGLPGRIGEYPDQGSHPGPLSFYLLAPTYRLLGSSSWSMEAGTVVIHLVAIGTGLWLVVPPARVGRPGCRRRPVRRPPPRLRPGHADPAVEPVPAARGLDARAAGGVGVLCGDAVALVPLVAAASYCAQTHVPYLPLGVGMVVLGRRRRRRPVARGPSRRARPPMRGRPPVGRRHRRRAVAAARRRPGPPLARQHPPPCSTTSARRPRRPSGSATASAIALRHLDVWTALSPRHLFGTGEFVDDASAWRGGVVAGVLGRGRRRRRALGLASAAAAAPRRRRRPHARRDLDGPHLRAPVVLPHALGVGHDDARPRRHRLDGGGAVAAACGRTIDLRRSPVLAAAPPWPWSPRSLADRGLRRRPAPRGAPQRRPSVRSPGRRTTPSSMAPAWPPVSTVATSCAGATPPTSAAPASGCSTSWSGAASTSPPTSTSGSQVTGHRTRPRADDVAQIHLATGAYVDRWRAVPDAVEVADVRPAHRRPDGRVRQRCGRGSSSGWRPKASRSASPLVDSNLFGISVDVRLSAADQADLATLIEHRSADGRVHRPAAGRRRRRRAVSDPWT